MSRHTPGPWEFDAQGFVRAKTGEGITIAGAADEFYGGFLVAESISSRNGPLIAAAPAMHRGLVEIRNSIAFVLASIPKKLQPGMQAIMDRATEALKGVDEE